MLRRRFLVASVISAWAGLAAAQPVLEEEDLAQAYGDKNFVSIATGTRQAINKAPSAAAVITAEDIADMGAHTLSEALEAIPGMHISRNFLQNNYTPTYGMRGIQTSASPHVLMMVNGIPRTSVYLGNPDELAVELPVENIARIEVIRGPGSAVYGADAFAGTINIITKTAADIDSTAYGARTGSFNSWSTWVMSGAQLGDFDVAGYLKIGSTGGQKRPVAVDIVGRSGNVNIGHDDVDAQFDVGYGNFRWRAGYTLRDRMGGGIGIAGALDPNGEVRSERISTDLNWSEANIAPDLSLSLQAAYMQLSNKVITPMTLFPAGITFPPPGGSFPDGVIGDPDKWERQLRLSASSVYTGFADHRLRFGLGHDELEIYKTTESKNFSISLNASGTPVFTPLPGGMTAMSGNDIFLIPHKRRVDYLYVQDEWSLARDWTLTGGVRYDHYSDFGSTTNPRLALVWEARQDLTAKLMYGTAFRAPSFVELYATGNPIALGNPSLAPEKINTLEAALTWQASMDLRTTLSLFQHEISSIISQTDATYLNTGKQKGSGGELEVSWSATSNLRLSGNYANQKNIDQTTGHDAGYAPHHHLYGRADWGFIPGWKLSGQFNYIAERKRAWGDRRPPLADYTTMDLTLHSERTKQGWDFSVSVFNLFDADVREPTKVISPPASATNAAPTPGITYDYPMPGRTFWLQARYSL